MRYLFLLLSLLPSLVGATNTPPEPHYDNAMQEASEETIAEVMYHLNSMKARGWRLFAGTYPETAVDSLVEEALKQRVRDGYHFAFGIAKNHETDEYAYVGFTPDSLANSNVFKELDKLLNERMASDCGGCADMEEDAAAAVFIYALTALNQQTGHAGQPQTDAEAYPYLPLTPALETRIQQYAGMIRRMVPLWEEVRVVHTTAALATSINYPTYMAKMKTFVDSIRTVTQLIEQDITEQATIASMYPTIDTRFQAEQNVNLIADGHDFFGSLRHDRALAVFKRELNTGKIPQMLEEVAALEYFFAYTYLTRIYDLAGKSELLNLVLDKIPSSTNESYTLQGFNKYDLYTLSTYNVSVSAPLLLASIGTTSSHDLMKIHYSNSRTGMKWKMYCACKGQSVDFGVGLSTDFLMPVNVAARITPSADGLNHANTAAITFYPPNFFRSPRYEFGNVNVAGDMAVNELSYTLAGQSVYINGGRVLGLSAIGLNFGVGASNSVGISANATAGAGKCFGWGVHDFKGMPVNLTDVSAPADPTPQQRIKSVTFGMLPNDPSLDDQDQAAIDALLVDIDTFTSQFPDKVINIKVYGYSAGYTIELPHPDEHSGPISSLNKIEDKMAVENYRTAKLMGENLHSTLISGLATLNVPSNRYTITLMPPQFQGPNEFADEIRSLQGNRRNYRWERHPKSWRLGIVTLHAAE